MISYPVSAPSQKNIYLITMDKESRFWDSLNNGAKDMAGILGVSYRWLAPEKRDVDEQISIFNQVVNSETGAILLAASDPVKISSSVKAAKEMGIKIIYVDAPAAEEAIVTLATENYNAGMIAGERMLYELNEMSIKEGSIGILGVTPENITTLNREKGFREIIGNDGRFKLLETKYDQGDPAISQVEAASFINENNDLVGLFGTNEGTTMGVGNAINSSDRKIIGIGFDYTEEIQDLLRRHVLDAVLVQNPFTMGYLGMAEAVAALNGYDTGPSFIDTGVSVITKDQPRQVNNSFHKE